MKDNENLDFEICRDLLYKIVEQKTGIFLEEFLTKKKNREMSNIRRVFVKILKIKFPSCKLEIIGDAVVRDHSNVSIQLQKHDELIYSDKIYASLFHKINDEFCKTYKKESTNTIDYLNYLRNNKNNLEDKLRLINLKILELENKQS